MSPGAGATGDPEMKLFVTGATGFIGSHFVREALAAGHEVIALRRPRVAAELSVASSSLLVSSEQPTTDRLSWLTANLDAVPSGAFEGVDALVHFAAYGVSPQPCEWDEALRVNVLESTCLVRNAIRAGVQRVVLCGSCVEYGRSAERYEFVPPDAPLEPVGAYASSKAAQSLALAGLCREAGALLTILRPFNVFGDGQHRKNFFPSLRRAAFAGDDFPMTPGEQIRDFVPVEDVAQAFLRAAASSQRFNGCSSQPFLIANVGTGKPQTIRAFAEHWWREWGAAGRLLPGALPYRDREVMRFVPKLNTPA